MPRRAGAKRRECGLYDRELSAGAAFVLAGFSAGTGVCARGGTAEQFGMRSLECEIEARWAHGETASSGHCGKPLPHAAFHLPFDMRTGLWKSIAAFCSSHACCLPRERQTGRLAMCCAFCSARVGIAIRAFSYVVRLSGVFGSLWDCAFLTGDPDRVTTGAYMKRNAAMCGVPLYGLLFAVIPRGVRWGMKCGSRTAAFLNSPHVVCGRVPLCKTLQ